MNNKSLLHVLVIDDSINDIEMYNNLITELGYKIKLTRIKEKEDIDYAYKSAKQDFLLYSYNYKHNTLKDIFNCLAKIDKQITIICLHDKSSNDVSFEKVLDDGVSALINKDDIVQFKQTIKQLFGCAQIKKDYYNLKARYLESEKRCHALMSSSKDAISYIHDGMHVTANDPYLDIFGFKDFNEIEGMPIMDLISDKQQNKFKNFLRDFKETGLEVKKVSIMLKNAKRNDFSATMAFSPATIDGEACAQIIIRNNSNAKALEKQLSLLSKTDQLTGLFNRKYLLETLDKRIEKQKIDKKIFSFFFISIDKFKILSEELGVLGSDLLINNISKNLKKTVPKTQLLCRFSGGSYCLILSQSKPSILEKFAKRLIKSVEEQVININEHPINSTISIGISIVDETIKSSSDALDRAKRAYQTVSKNKQSQYLIYHPKKGELTQTQLDNKWKRQITLSLKENKFIPLYTPIVNLSDENTHRYQVKPSLLDEKDKAIEYEKYKEAATRTGIAKQIDRWIILHTLKLIRQRMNDKYIFYSYFICLSSRTLDDPTLFRWLNGQLKESEIPPKSLVFTVRVEDAQLKLKQTQALSSALKSLKCGFMLDKFGSGPDPFLISQHIPFDFVRIHPDFVNNLSTNQENQESIKQMFEKAKKMHKTIIIPNVNDPGTLTVLWSFGAELIQGDFVGKQRKIANYDFKSMVM